MAEISAAMVKELREKTGSGIMDCKKALKESDGDVAKALDFLRKKGLAAAAKRSARATSEGTVMSYIHMGGKIGVMVEINCETDFVAKNEDFQAFAKDIAMHIAAVNPAGLAPEDISEDVVAKEREIYRERALEQGKPENIVDKIVEGQVQKFYKDSCLMSQAYVKNPQITIEDYTKEVIGKMGENIRIRRFVRYQLGE
ncbi:translation elongation factor Ts [Desulfoluna butyratoxydans]|uniref:Elongation factor Ts n=1 Tax=Desulfoluna butyratoxydans TaxID=231438 RepID=A0A4U8YM76_9BACT|nr:translation elongation factor Ts [Desulfoluna butyratoxydans]VFQ42662.1 translation elongation factor efts/ef1b dimerisation [Desulfoluna butyratoxydans]